MDLEDMLMGIFIIMLSLVLISLVGILMYSAGTIFYEEVYNEYPYSMDCLEGYANIYINANNYTWRGSNIKKNIVGNTNAIFFSGKPKFYVIKDREISSIGIAFIEEELSRCEKSIIVCKE